MKSDSFSLLEQAFWFQEGPGVRNTQFREKGVKLLNVGNILKNGGIDLNKTKRHISEDEAKTKYKHFLCDEGDLVIASSGISFDEDGLLRTRGDFIKSHQLPLCMNTSVIRFKSKNGNSLNYLKHWLQSYEFRNQITKLVTGSAQQNFGPTHLKKVKINLPTNVEQKKTIALLDTAEDLFFKRQKVISKLYELSESIFNEMSENCENYLPIKDVLIKKNFNKVFPTKKIWSLTLENIESNTGKLLKEEIIAHDKLGNSTFYF